MSVQELERITTIYQADLHHTPIGWGYTVYRNGTIVGRATGWLSLYRSRQSALAAATRFARHDREQHHIHLDA